MNKQPAVSLASPPAAQTPPPANLHAQRAVAPKGGDHVRRSVAHPAIVLECAMVAEDAVSRPALVHAVCVAVPRQPAPVLTRQQRWPTQVARLAARIAARVDAEAMFVAAATATSPGLPALNVSPARPIAHEPEAQLGRPQPSPARLSERVVNVAVRSTAPLGILGL